MLYGLFSCTTPINCNGIFLSCRDLFQANFDHNDNGDTREKYRVIGLFLMVWPLCDPSKRAFRKSNRYHSALSYGLSKTEAGISIFNKSECLLKGNFTCAGAFDTETYSPVPPRLLETKRCKTRRTESSRGARLTTPPAAPALLKYDCFGAGRGANARSKTRKKWWCTLGRQFLNNWLASGWKWITVSQLVYNIG